MKEDIILKMKGISKSFGATKALDNLDFELRRGEVHALLGENGAGKSTLIKVLGGVHQPEEGVIFIDGQERKMQSIQDAQEAGIGIIHQEIVLVPYLTVTENIFLGREILSPLHMKDKKEMNRLAEEMTRNLGLNIDVTTKVRNLSIAQQQLVEIVKAISFNIKLLVMDEPTSSLSDEEVKRLFLMMDRLKRDNVSIIYISHRMEELFAVTDRVTVMRDGTYVGTVETKETNTDELVKMMVGRNLVNYYTRDYNMKEKEVLRVENLTQDGIFENVNFKVHEGEILGFSGLVGAGRSEIMQAIFGNEKYDSGKIFLHGKEVHFKSSQEAIKNGVAMVPEDRKKQGLTLINSVGYNLTLASLDLYKTGMLLSEGKRLEVIRKYIEDLNIKTSSIDSLVSSLSGGNQQKVVLGKWLSTNPKILILDEPTRGVDVGAKAEIYGIINQLAQQGMAIIMVSSELPEIINMCDNVCIVKEGKITGYLKKEDMNQEVIMSYATGGQKE
ncbi:ABC-type sugar transport system ATPase subunit [Aequitasia blattaphilus]|uniref:Sugar ABC transporter ATP-binding protein n=1 Tax=Aequitasia blattaphilus TaxID=2949332 RepID=A0ABT1E7M1_9FIRM|nr:sugar ABC transporter ATP-binding protein [Aequitasia blattaphilus]MCP1101825.1 sugar ABC transporter ATP-binding protein [Aequitasia blattaphilus]MCR8614465.1 sugar ABC transporter ATP-binding protein [Aequitasia blattaphilus]